jgi:hypothetical protein
MIAFCECSLSMQEETCVFREARGWEEVCRLTQGFVGSEENRLFLTDCDDALLRYANATSSEVELTDPRVPQALLELEATGWKIAALTSRDNFIGKTCLHPQFKKLGISFKSVLPEEDFCASALKEAWARGTQIDCDCETGAIFTTCVSLSVLFQNDQTFLVCGRLLPLPRADLRQAQSSPESWALVDKAIQRAVTCSKGEALAAATHVGLLSKPDVLAFVDDDVDNLTSVAEYCRLFSIRSLMIRYVAESQD